MLLKFDDFYSFDEIKNLFNMTCEKIKLKKKDYFFDIEIKNRNIVTEANSSCAGNIVYDNLTSFKFILKRICEYRTLFFKKNKKYIVDQDIEIVSSEFRDNEKYNSCNLNIRVRYAYHDTYGTLVWGRWSDPLDSFDSLSCEQTKNIKSFISSFYDVVEIIK